MSLTYLLRRRAARALTCPALRAPPAEAYFAHERPGHFPGVLRGEPGVAAAFWYFRVGDVVANTALGLTRPWDWPRGRRLRRGRTRSARPRPPAWSSTASTRGADIARAALALAQPGRRAARLPPGGAPAAHPTAAAGWPGYAGKITLPSTPSEEFAAAMSSGLRRAPRAASIWSAPNSTFDDVSEPVTATSSHPSRGG